MILNSRPFCQSKGSPRWVVRHYNTASEFSEIFLASVNPLDVREPCSANWHGALTQFHGRGAEDGRVGADCRGSGSRPRALSLSRRAGTGRSSFSLHLSLSLSRACSFSSIFSSFLLHRRLALRTYILMDVPERPYLHAYIVSFTSERCVISSEDSWRSGSTSAELSFCWVHAVEQHFTEQDRWRATSYSSHFCHI